MNFFVGVSLAARCAQPTNKMMSNDRSSSRPRHNARPRATSRRRRRRDHARPADAEHVRRAPLAEPPGRDVATARVLLGSRRRVPRVPDRIPDRGARRRPRRVLLAAPRAELQRRERSPRGRRRRPGGPERGLRRARERDRRARRAMRWRQRTVPHRRRGRHRLGEDHGVRPHHA